MGAVIFSHTPTPAATRTASAGRGSVRGSEVMTKRTPLFMAIGIALRAGRPVESVETDKSVHAPDHVAQDGQAAKDGLFAHGQVAALRSVGAGEQFQAVVLELLQMRVPQGRHRLVEAVKVNVRTLGQGDFGEANAVREVRMIRRSGNQQAEFFPAQGHVTTVGKLEADVKRGGNAGEAGRISIFNFPGPIAPNQSAFWA